MSDPRLPDMTKRESLIVHIEGLQTTLTKRNARIADLEQQLSEGSTSPAAQRALAQEYKRGWRECAGHLMETTRVAAQALGRVRSDAWEVYLKQEKRSQPEEVEEIPDDLSYEEQYSERP